MMRARVLAALAAAVMVAGAWYVRTDVIEKDGGRGSGSSEQVTAGRIVCAAELRDACEGDPEALEATAGALLTAEDARASGVGAWVTPGPWAEIVEAGRPSASAELGFESTVLASTDLVVVVRKGANPCAADASWRCFKDAVAAGKRVSAPAGGTFVRLALRAAAAGAILDKTDYATNDLSEGDAPNLLAAFERAVDASRGFGATSVSDFVIKTGSADAFVTTAADADLSGVPTAIFDIVTPTPRIRIDATASYLRDPGRGENDRLRDRLVDHGWGPRKTGANGLPSPGVLFALREAV
ncbi:MAG TPA: hypothetical protein VF230_19380 [Acidimicrobiales bacterium]